MDEKDETETETTVWNDELEAAVKEIGDESKGYKIMHIHMAQRATQIYTHLTIAGIVLGPLASLFSSVDSFANPERSVASIISIFLGFLSGVTVAIIKFGKYDEVSNANKTASARYTSIESNVRRQLSLQRKDRIPAMTYMDWLDTKYEDNKKHIQPYIQDRFEEFQTKYNKQDKKTLKTIKKQVELSILNAED